MKKGVLVVSFGSTYRDTREKNIDGLVREFWRTYPQAAYYQAYSSGMVRNILKERDSLLVPGIGEALEQMKAEGITHAYVQPTHILDGIENGKMKEIVKRFEPEFEVIRVGRPLLDREEDFKEAARSVWKELEAVVKEDLLILMGHGTNHEANSAYEKLEGYFRKDGRKNVYLSTVEGTPLIEDVMEKLAAEERNGRSDSIKKRAVLAPFMLVAGDHARNDMAGEEDSYAGKLKAAGYETECILKGLGEYEGIRKLFLRHLEEIMEIKEE